MRPFAAGAIMLAIYPGELPIHDLIDDLLEQAVLAESVGFDGVTLSEHHGLPGYSPDPLQASAWVLQATRKLWSGPCPMLLPLRPWALVVEDIAWLAARFPGRVGAGFAPGYAAVDFKIAGADLAHRSERFVAALPEVVAALSGRAVGALAADPAVAATVDSPIPIVSTAAGPVAARRAARVGAGVILGPFNSSERSRAILDAYREAGGTGPRILIRRPWIGSDASERMEGLGVHYRSIGADGSWMPTGMSSQLVSGPDTRLIAERLATALEDTGATALRVMFNLPGATPRDILQQIERFGTEVLPGLRARFTARHQTAMGSSTASGDR